VWATCPQFQDIFLQNNLDSLLSFPSYSVGWCYSFIIWWSSFLLFGLHFKSTSYPGWF
jgi:hypothetical protein